MHACMGLCIKNGILMEVRGETYHVDGELAVGEAAGGALREVDAVRRIVGLG